MQTDREYSEPIVGKTIHGSQKYSTTNKKNNWKSNDLARNVSTKLFVLVTKTEIELFMGTGLKDVHKLDTCLESPF